MSKSLATKHVAAVLIGVGLILAFSFSFATTAKADALSDLQAQVNALLAQIASLQAGSASTAAGACFTFTGGAGEVMQIQKFLNSHGAQVAASGAGSPGNETSTFGPLTRKAVAKFQADNGITPAAGNWGPITRAKANSLCGVTTTTTTSGGTTTTVVTPTGPGLTVVAAAQPANSLAPGGTSRVPFTTFTLTNNTGAAVTVNGITVQRAGLGQDAVFSGVVLVDAAGLQVGIAKTLNSNHQATVGDTFTIPAGASQTLTVAGNMQSNSTLSSYSGQIISLSVVGVNTSVPVNGSLPITGAQQTINSTLSVGSVTTNISSLDPNSAQSKNIGDSGLKFSGLRFTAGSAEDLKLYSIRWRLNGSVSAGDLANVSTVVSGTSYPATISSDGRYYTTVFAGGLLITKGNAIDTYVTGDIVGSNSSGRVVEFDVDKTSDIYLVGQLYGYGIAPAAGSTALSTAATHASALTASQPWFQGSTFSVTGASVTSVAKANEVPAQNIAANVPNQPLGGYVVDMRGESVSVQSQVFNIATSSTGTGFLTNVSIFDENGAVVAGPVDATRVSDTVQKVTFTDTVTYKTGRHVFTLKGKLPSAFTNAGTVIVSFDPSTAWTNITGQTTGNTVTFPSGTVTLNTMTVRAAQLVINMSTQPPSQNIVAGSSGVTFGNVQLDAGQSGEDVRLSAIPLRLALASSAAVGHLTSCQLFDGGTALNTGSNVPTTLTSASTPNSFTLDNSLTVAKGTVKTLALKCNTTTAAVGTFRWSVNTSDTFTVTGVTSSNTVGTSSGLTVTTGNAGLMTVQSGSLTVSTDASSPAYAVVAGGATGVTVGVIKFRAANEAINLNKLGLSLTNSASSTATDLTQVYVYQGATQVGTALFTGANTVATTTFATPITLPKDADAILTVKADIAAIDINHATDGHLIAIDYQSADATGAASGVNIQGSGSTAVSGVRTFKSYPVVTLDSLPGNGIADGRLMRFKVTANAGGNVGIGSMEFTIATTSAVVTSINMYGYTDTSYSQGIPGVGTGGLVNTSAQSAPLGAFTITPSAASSATIQVPAGQTYYFEVRGTVAGSGTAYNVATTLLGDNAYIAIANPAAGEPMMTSVSGVTGGGAAANNFVWSPNATTTVGVTANDWTNGFGLAGLPASGIVQNRTN